MAAESPAPKLTSKDFQESPVYWFARYEGAILKQRLVDAREARAKLRALGYEVNPVRPNRAGSKGGAR